jgi:hypothetical protein
MTISDQSRYDLHQRLAEVLGADEAATLMEHLPPVGWADVATKRDLDHLGHDLRAEMAVGFAGVRLELQREVTALRVELLREVGGLQGEIGELRGEIGEVRGDLGRQLTTLFLGLVGLQFSAAGLALALSRLL